MRKSFLFIFFNSIAERIAERILAFEDYFLNFNSLRLSEIYLFLQCLLWFAWSVFFDVANSSPVYRYMFSQNAWAAVFGALSGAHIFGVAANSKKIRSRVVTAYGVLWFVWGAIAAYAAIGSTATPTMLNLCLLSIAVAIHLSKTEFQTVNN